MLTPPFFKMAPIEQLIERAGLGLGQLRRSSINQHRRSSLHDDRSGSVHRSRAGRDVPSEQRAIHTWPGVWLRWRRDCLNLGWTVDPLFGSSSSISSSLLRPPGHGVTLLLRVELARGKLWCYFPHVMVYLFKVII